MKKFTGNEFLDVSKCPFEIIGFFEELFDAEFGNFLGTRPVETLDRKLGYDGRREFLITENVTLSRGHTKKVVRASKSNPLRVYSIVQIICGRTIDKKSQS